MGQAQAPPAADNSSGDNPREKGLPEVGSVLGTYRVLSRVGSGGMAVIYRAEHVRLRREVALKVLRPALASRPASLRRFVEEARAVNEIGHPNIVDIIDIIEDYDTDPPVVYMVMELLTGEDLHSRIAREGALSVRDALEIACQTADALTATHAENILHRDLKPSNVFLAQIDGRPTVKLLDFGLLKHFGDRPSRHLTKPEVVPGTPLYMSPEQIMGGVLDQRTDVYGFGLVVYEMLASVPPFAGKQDTEVLVLHAREPAPALIDRRPELDPKLASAVMQCLKKNPDDRYPSVAAARDALVLSANLPLQRAPRSRADSVLMTVLGLPTSRRPLWLFVGLLALSSLFLLGLLWWRGGASPRRGGSRRAAWTIEARPVPAAQEGVPTGGASARATDLQPKASGADASATDVDPLASGGADVPSAASAPASPVTSMRPKPKRAMGRAKRRAAPGVPGRKGRRSGGRRNTSKTGRGGDRALEAVTVDPWSH